MRDLPNPCITPQEVLPPIAPTEMPPKVEGKEVGAQRLREVQEKMAKEFQGELPPDVTKALGFPEKAEAPGPKVVQLDQITLLKIELMSSKRRLNRAEEEKLLLLLQSIRKEAKELQLEESRLFSEVVQRLGMEAGKNLRLLDREKGLCAIE